MEKNRIKYLIRWPLTVLVLHIILTYIGGYYWWEYIDKIMHTLGGMSIAAATMQAIAYAKTKNIVGFIHPFLLISFVIAVVALVAVGWEFFEFILDHTLRTNMQPSIADTMGDLLCGLIGGTMVAILKRK